MTRVARLLWPMLFAAMVFAVYQLKFQVEEKEKELSKIERAIQQEREAIQVLRAEWSYLNQPERLRKLAAGGFGMQPVTARQISSLDHLGRRLAAVAPIEVFTREAALPASTLVAQ